MSLNTIMCLEVLHLLHNPYAHALVRSAGSRGVAVYEELVEDGGVALCVESFEDTCSTHIPLHIVPKLYDPYKHLEASTVVVFHNALLRAGLTFDILRGYIIQHIRYDCSRGRPSSSSLLLHNMGEASVLSSPSSRYKNNNKNTDAVISGCPSYDTTVLGVEDRYTETFPLIGSDTIEITGCDDVSTIQNAFFSDIVSIKTVDLSPLRSVTTIGDSFLRNCRNLQVLDLSPMVSVVTIGNHFLRSCWALCRVDLTSLSSTNLTSVGYHCLSECRELNVVEMGGLGKFQKAGEYFMFRCKKLTSITLPTYTKEHCHVEDRLLCGCKGLSHIDLQPLANISSIGSYFMGGCISLQVVDLSPLKSLLFVGSNFLGGCINLTEIDLSALVTVVYIGNDFMAGCEGLVQVDLAPLGGVRSIRQGFLFKCKRLKTINVSKLENVPEVDQINFLGLCGELQVGTSSCSVKVDDLKEGNLKVAYTNWIILKQK